MQHLDLSLDSLDSETTVKSAACACSGWKIRGGASWMWALPPTMDDRVGGNDPGDGRGWDGAVLDVTTVRSAMIDFSPVRPRGSCTLRAGGVLDLDQALV
jgi:hypothetical protein